MPLRGPRLKVIRRLGTPLPGLTRKVPKERARALHPVRRPYQRRSAYRVRLEEKQKVRYHYGVSERQLRRYLDRARRSGEAPGDAFLALLERRLDNVVFRLGLAPTIVAARQLVSHGHLLVNGRRVDRPALLLATGDAVAPSPRARRILSIREAVERGPELRLPRWLAVDPDDPFAGRVVGLPARSDVPFVVNASAIVEFYAR